MAGLLRLQLVVEMLVFSLALADIDLRLYDILGREKNKPFCVLQVRGKVAS